MNDDVLVGGREPVRIVIADYDAAWPERYEVERARIVAAVPASLIVRVEHIGSTAVEGLAAKPIIDVLMTSDDPSDPAIHDALLGIGYVLRVREPEHRMFRTQARDVHVHVWRDTDPAVARYVLLRDRLRASEADRRSYETLKRELAARAEWQDMNDYADAKSALIDAIVSRAL